MTRIPLWLMAIIAVVLAVLGGRTIFVAAVWVKVATSPDLFCDSPNAAKRVPYTHTSVGSKLSCQYLDTGLYQVSEWLLQPPPKREERDAPEFDVWSRRNSPGLVWWDHATPAATSRFSGRHKNEGLTHAHLCGFGHHHCGRYRTWRLFLAPPAGSGVRASAAA